MEPVDVHAPLAPKLSVVAARASTTTYRILTTHFPEEFITPPGNGEGNSNAIPQKRRERSCCIPVTMDIKPERSSFRAVF
jgi:hypothetical protein